MSTERVDDIPVLIEQMKRMDLPTLIDTPFPAHGSWYGLSMGWLSTSWLSSILTQGNHHFTDDRLELVLRHLRDESRWEQFESHLNQHPIRVYDLSPDRVDVDSPTANAYATVSPEGLCQFGHSKDHRPD